MNDHQKAIFELYADGTRKPSAGTVRTAYFRGWNGQPCMYLPSSLAWAAWKAGKAAKARQTDVGSLVDGVLDELAGKPANHLKRRPDKRP